MSDKQIMVEVTLAFLKEQHLVKVLVSETSSIKETIEKSQIFSRFSSVPADVRNLEHGVGIFGKEIHNPAEYQLKEGDRIEIYRPLLIEPKAARLKRSKKSD